MSRSKKERLPTRNSSAHLISFFIVAVTRLELSSRSKQPTSSETSDDDDRNISVMVEFVSFANERTMVVFPDNAFPTKRHGQPMTTLRATASIGSNSCTGIDESKSSRSYREEFDKALRGKKTSPI